MKHFEESWRNPTEEAQAIYKDRVNSWKRQEAFVKIEKPTRIERAHVLGYKAKQGFVIVRSRVPKGDRKRPKVAGGRVPSKSGRFFSTSKSKQRIAEERTARKYSNLEVLNSYWVAEDGNFAWYEVILVDKYHPAIKADHKLNWICEPHHTGRVYRGKTSAGQRGRGLHKKGFGTEKIRPSLRAHKRLGK